MEHREDLGEDSNRRASRAAAEGGSLAETVRHCARLVSTTGPVAALRFLNARTRFRFTGVYRADPPLLRNAHLFDRENPTLNVSGEVCALDESYCSLVWGSGSWLGVGDAGTDPRLVGHAARESIISYCGVPIRCANGTPWGTLCHFDVRPRLVPESELALMEAVAALLAERLAAGG